MVSVDCDIEFLRAIDPVRRGMQMRRSPIDGKLWVAVHGNETVESYLRYNMGTYGPVKLLPAAREHIADLIREDTNRIISQATEWQEATQ